MQAAAPFKLGARGDRETNKNVRNDQRQAGVKRSAPLNSRSISPKLARELATGPLAHVTAISGTRSFANREIVIARVINRTMFIRIEK